jgi:GTP diphosphokinase / guanosine-3',5'-bis(diphosphate) 3'-diphosphatase
MVTATESARDALLLDADTRVTCPKCEHEFSLEEGFAKKSLEAIEAASAAALLHDTIEDTQTSYGDLRGQFGEEVADTVVELTDTKFLGKEARKRLQVAKAGKASDAAKQVKLADKICNLRDILASPPANWSLARQQKYFDWAKDVVDEVRGANLRLERVFDRLYRQRPE